MRGPELFPMHPQMEAPIIAVPHRRTAPKKTYGESTPGTEDGAGSVLADAIGGKLGGGRGELKRFPADGCLSTRSTHKS